MKTILISILIAFLFNAHMSIAAKTAKETIHRGISLDTEWLSDAHGSIYTDVSTKSLGLKTTPTYLVSVVATSNLQNQFLSSSPSSLDLDGILSKYDPLTNVTGIHTTRNASPHGFRVRLSYTEGDSRNLTVDTAKYGKWRVRWVAVTDEHPNLKEMTGGNVASQLSALEMLVKEDAEVIKGLLSTDYQITLQEHNRLEKEREKVRIQREKERKKKEEEDKKKKEEKIKKQKEKEEKEKANKEQKESTTSSDEKKSETKE